MLECAFHETSTPRPEQTTEHELPSLSDLGSDLITTTCYQRRLAITSVIFAICDSDSGRLDISAQDIGSPGREQGSLAPSI